MNLEKQKENFKNHVASFTDYLNIKIVDFKDPNSSRYRIRFLFEEDYYRLHISGDLGELIATNFYNMTFEKFSHYVNNTGYFEEKINCCSRALYVYDEELAKLELKERINDCDLIYEVREAQSSYGAEEDDEVIEEFMDEVFERYSSDTGIDSTGYDKLKEIDPDAFEWAFTLGKKETGILELYMLAFKLAMEQLNKTTEA